MASSSNVGTETGRSFSGAELRRRRVAAELRPEELALRLGRSVHTISAYERGLQKPPAEILGALADRLGCAVDDFYVTSGEVA